MGRQGRGAPPSPPSPSCASTSAPSKPLRLRRCSSRCRPDRLSMTTCPRHPNPNQTLPHPKSALARARVNRFAPCTACYAHCPDTSRGIMTAPRRPELLAEPLTLLFEPEKPGKRKKKKFAANAAAIDVDADSSPSRAPPAFRRLGPGRPAASTSMAAAFAADFFLPGCCSGSKHRVNGFGSSPGGRGCHPPMQPVWTAGAAGGAGSKAIEAGLLRSPSMISQMKLDVMELYSLHIATRITPQTQVMQLNCCGRRAATTHAPAARMRRVAELATLNLRKHGPLLSRNFYFHCSTEMFILL
jgi:hypothetical protein